MGMALHEKPIVLSDWPKKSKRMQIRLNVMTRPGDTVTLPDAVMQKSSIRLSSHHKTVFVLCSHISASVCELMDRRCVTSARRTGSSAGTRPNLLIGDLCVKFGQIRLFVLFPERFNELGNFLPWTDSFMV